VFDITSPTTTSILRPHFLCHVHTLSPNFTARSQRFTSCTSTSVMLLHAAAGLHGHEYSPTQTTKRNQQVQTTHIALSQDTQPDMGSHTTSRPASQLIPGMSYVSSFLPSPRSFWERPTSDCFFKNYLPARFHDVKEENEELQSDTSSPRTSADVEHIPLYIEPDTETEPGCDTTCNSSECSKTKRGKTRFHFARPVPGSLNRHKRTQPRILLQLRRERHGRPLPSIEVVPAPDIAGSKLNSDSLLVTRSDHDKSASWYGMEKGAEDYSKDRDVLAAITPCGPHGDGSAEIAMEDGTVWAASRRPNGGYEFCHTTEQGTLMVVRWVKRHPVSPTASQQFSFCTMDPLLRKHPFLGSLKPHELDVFETYTSSNSRPYSSRPASYAGDGSLPGLSVKQRVLVADDEKRLMTVTGIWVSICEEGWPGTLPSTGRPCKPRTAAVSRKVSADTTRSPQPSLPTSPTRASFAETCRAECPVSSPFQGKRAASTGAAYMERRRAAAAAAAAESAAAATNTVSPSSSGDVKLEAAEVEKHPHRKKMRTWAHKIFRMGSKSSKRDVVEH
jgi:hypothetical protein